MVATSARIGFVTRQFRRAVSKTASVETKYGSMGRETADPLDTYFSTVADAQFRADERQALLSPDRRLFTVTTSEPEVVLDMLNASEVPTVRYVDTERGIDRSFIVTEIIVDAMANDAQLKIWG